MNLNELMSFHSLFYKNDEYVELDKILNVWKERVDEIEQKISLNLKNGIPILGGLIVSFLSNMRLIASGPGAIALGVISGFILNRLGNVANNKYVKYLKAQQKELSQNNNPKDLDKVKS